MPAAAARADAPRSRGPTPPRSTVLLVRATPGVDATHDEEPLARLDESESASLAHERAAGSDRRDLLLEPLPLSRERRDVCAPDGQLVLRPQVRVQRLPVEEREHGDPAERQQSSRTEHNMCFSFQDDVPAALI